MNKALKKRIGGKWGMVEIFRMERKQAAGKSWGQVTIRLFYMENILPLLCFCESWVTRPSRRLRRNTRSCRVAEGSAGREGKRQDSPGSRSLQSEAGQGLEGDEGEDSKARTRKPEESGKKRSEAMRPWRLTTVPSQEIKVRSIWTWGRSMTTDFVSTWSLVYTRRGPEVCELEGV